jgi:hypothetical protein
MRLSCSLPIGQVVGNGERVPLTGLLRFDPADPIAISLVIRVTTGQTVEWTFARNLLAADTDQPVGVGEVRVRLLPEVVGNVRSPRVESEPERPSSDWPGRTSALLDASTICSVTVTSSKGRISPGYLRR